MTNTNVINDKSMGTKEKFKKLTFNEMALWMAENEPNRFAEFEKHAYTTVYPNIKQQQFNNDGTPMIQINKRTGKPEFVYVKVKDLNNPQQKISIVKAKKWFCENFFPHYLAKDKKETMEDVLAMARAKAKESNPNLATA